MFYFAVFLVLLFVFPKGMTLAIDILFGTLEFVFEILGAIVTMIVYLPVILLFLVFLSLL